MSTLAEGLEWKHIYWVKGDMRRGAAFQNAVKDPPCAGWMHAVVIPGEKRSVIFCPYTLQAFSVRNSCGELEGAKEPKNPDAKAFVIHTIEKHWKECQSYGWSRDYDTAALVLRRLGTAVPTQVMRGGEEDVRKKGGKTADGELKKPVKRTSKRGKFLEWMLEEDGSRSVREAMAEFGMTRSNVLSYLYMLKKDHGIGYELVGGIATVQVPDGAGSPFDDPLVPIEDDDDDEWLG